MWATYNYDDLEKINDNFPFARIEGAGFRAGRNSRENFFNELPLPPSDVIVESVANNAGWTAVKTIPIKRLAYQETASCFVCFQQPDTLEGAYNTGFSNTLKFIVKDCDPTTGEPDDADGYPDEYALEMFEVTLSDYIQKVANVDFINSWEEMGPENELEDTFVLSAYSSLQQAIEKILDFLGMHACERTDQVPEGKQTHTLILAGTFVTGGKILVRARLALNLGMAQGVTMNMTVRSNDMSIPELILTSLA